MTHTEVKIKGLVRKHGFVFLSPITVFAGGRRLLLCRGSEDNLKGLKEDIKKLDIKKVEISLLEGVLFLAWTE